MTPQTKSSVNICGEPRVEVVAYGAVVCSLTPTEARDYAYSLLRVAEVARINAVELAEFVELQLLESRRQQVAAVAVK